MRLKRHLETFLVLALLALPSLASAQTAASTDIDPGAIEALNKMGAYLRTLKAFRVQSQTSRDQVLEDGEKITYSGTSDVLVEAPNRLRAQVESDRKSRMYFYDGKSFTLYSPRLGYYATAAAPPTLRQLTDALDEKYDIELPMGDLFLWGTEDSAVKLITSATDIGPSVVEGTSCEHYAFRQPGLDWQVWIQQGPNPLPRKLVLTTMTDEARPAYISVMTWDLAPAYNVEAFTFVPPKDAKKIVFAQTRPESGRR